MTTIMIDVAVCVGAVLFFALFISICRGGGSSGSYRPSSDVARLGDARQQIDRVYDRAEHQVRAVTEQYRYERR